ncbi:MAG TPA: kelch repeat-containing protein [Thermoanaerobaculia bacterium]|nr:kelch repeat-containing protein [Thermoanaerobaculia bacterium]
MSRISPGLLFLILTLSRSISAGSWITLAPVLEARQEVAVATAGGKIYLIGGIGNGRVLTSVEQYDPVTNQWRFVSPIPQPLHHSAAVAIGESIYLIGGYRTLAFDPTDAVYRYDIGSDRWQSVARLPSPRGAHAAAAIEGKVYVVGGVPGGNQLTVYDPLTYRWAALAPMPTPREHLAAVAVAGQLFAISGRLQGNVSAFESYDPMLNRWRTLAPIPTSRSGIAAAAVGERIYVFGGEGNTRASTGVFAETESYSVSSGRWSTETPMLTPRHGIGAAAIGDVIYIPAGAAVQGFGTSATHEAFITPAAPRRRAARKGGL